jgi:hypothetical protein
MNKLKGFTGKILEVDLSSKAIKTIPLDENWLRMYLAVLVMHMGLYSRYLIRTPILWDLKTSFFLWVVPYWVLLVLAQVELWSVQNPQ